MDSAVNCVQKERSTLNVIFVRKLCINMELGLHLLANIKGDVLLEMSLKYFI